MNFIEMGLIMNKKEEIKWINRQIRISNIAVWIGIILVCASFGYLVYIVCTQNYGGLYEYLFAAITGFITILGFYALLLQNNSKLKMDLQVKSTESQGLPIFTQEQLKTLEAILKASNQPQEQIIEKVKNEIKEIKESQVKIEESIEKISNKPNLLEIVDKYISKNRGS